LSPLSAPAQQAVRQGAAAKPERSSSITGRVTGDGGQPIADAPIRVLPANVFGDQNGAMASLLRPVTTDADGRFEIKDLLPRAYRIAVSVPGYITSDNSQQTYYRPGNTVALSMIKGGVITGKVINATGEPISGIRVRAVRIKDADNRPVRLDLSGLTSSGGSSAWDWMTDDRGSYRIYGLESGIYTVAAGGRGLASTQRSGYDGDAPTYHPSGTADTAAEVTVRAGAESTNIDIRYRENRGLVISGSISGEASNFAMVMMRRASSGLPEQMSFVLPNSSGRSFIFDAVADGDYYLYALSVMGLGEGNTSASKAKRISVKGEDVTGVDLPLALLGSVSGRVVIETAPGADCKPARSASLQEIVIKAQSDRKEKLRDEPDSFLAAYSNNAPNDKGEFQIQYLDQGLKRMVVQPPGEDLYIRSISMPPATPDAKPKDLARDGITIKGGDKVTGITVTLAEGAASLSGKIVLPKDDLTPLARLKVYLVPSQTEDADNLLRYFEARVQPDSTFKLGNLAPGRYWIFARPIMEEESVENFQRPLAWDAADRMGLRFEGEASANVIELKQCQMVSDFSLRYTPPSKPKKPGNGQ